MKSLVLAAAVAALSLPAFAQGTPSTPGATVYFVGLQDGATVQSPLKVNFGLSGMGVAPAEVMRDGTGHHHLLVNRAPFGEGAFGEDELMLAVPSDANHFHFGGGQTEVTLDLPPGEHTLQLVLGDAGHVPHDPAVVSDVITIVVE